MATTIVQFPPGIPPTIGGNSSITPQGAWDADMFVAPVQGVYLVSIVAHVVFTDGLGGNAEIQGFTPTTGMIVDMFIDGSTVPPVDSQFTFACWFDQGDVFDVTVARDPGFTGLIYTVFVNAIRLL